MPAIDPFSILNRETTEKDIKEWLDHYQIPTDLPLVVQISRFDRWKDPQGVVKAFKIVTLIKNEKARNQMGRRAKELVRKNFLLTRYLEQYLDLFNSFETVYRLKKKS